jgi:hypothetical protein
MSLKRDGQDVNTTTDPDRIQDWIENHDGKPAIANRGEQGDAELDIKFEEEDDDQDLDVIGWNEFFEIFEQQDTAFAFINNNGEHLNSEKFDFIGREQPTNEIEEPEVFRNTLETENGAANHSDTLP